MKKKIEVSEDWLLGLLSKIDSFEEARKNWIYGDVNNDRILNRAVELSGYASSAELYLKRELPVSKEEK